VFLKLAVKIRLKVLNTNDDTGPCVLASVPRNPYQMKRAHLEL